MAFVGMQMLDNLYHHKPPSLDKDWSKDSFAPIPSFVDTGSALIDKSNVDAFIQAGKNLTTRRSESLMRASLAQLPAYPEERLLMRKLLLSFCCLLSSSVSRGLRSGPPAWR